MRYLPLILLLTACKVSDLSNVTDTAATNTDTQTQTVREGNASIVVLDQPFYIDYDDQYPKPCVDRTLFYYAPKKTWTQCKRGMIVDADIQTKGADSIVPGPQGTKGDRGEKGNAGENAARMTLNDSIRVNVSPANSDMVTLENVALILTADGQLTISAEIWSGGTSDKQAIRNEARTMVYKKPVNTNHDRKTLTFQYRNKADQVRVMHLSYSVNKKVWFIEYDSRSFVRDDKSLGTLTFREISSNELTEYFSE